MKYVVVIFALLLLYSCKSPTARKPITKKSGHFIEQSIVRNKNILKQEVARIQEIIKQDSTHRYHSSAQGFWYRYNQKDTTDNSHPKIGDVVTFNYAISTIEGQPIYTRQEIGERVLVIDKEDIFTGLRQGLKLMRTGETVTFLLPSYKAFGFYGDKKRIGRNVPVQLTVTLNSIEKKQQNL